MQMGWRKSAAGAAIGVTFLLGGVHSSTAAIEEVVVTAQKRSESVQDVPISITALSGDDIERRGFVDMQELAQFVPNFDMPASNNMRNVSVRIRGIGSSGTNAGIESSVGVFLDGLYMPSGAMALGELADINTFEILRGPQGTLYGRNTPVGALNVTTRPPSREPELLARAGGGDYDHWWVNGYVGGALSETAAGRLSFWYRDRHGFERNRFTGNDVNDNNQQGLRGKLLFEPSDALQINVIGYVSEVERTCCMAEQIDPLAPLGIASDGFLAASAAAGYPFENFDDSDHKVDGDDEGDDRTDSIGASIQADWTLPDGTTLTSITGWQDWENRVLISADSLKQPVIISRQDQTNEIFSQEFRITSPTGQTFEYLAGLYLYAQDTQLLLDSSFREGANRVFPVPSPPCDAPCSMRPGDRGLSDFDQETRSVAGYGSVTWHITDRWDVTGGLRWSWDDKEASIVHPNSRGNSFVMDNLVFPEVAPGKFDRSDDQLTWSANTRYHLTDDVMLFAVVSTGFKSGGFNSRRLPPGSLLEFEEETSITYEAGTKSHWLDRRLMVNATLFWTVLEDFQETTLAPSGAGFIVDNAGEQKVRGLEADLAFVPVPSLTLSASLAYLASEYTEFPAAECGLGEAPDNPDGTCNRKGETPAMSPEWAWTVGGEWSRPIGESPLQWHVGVDYAWVDEQNLTRVTLDEPAQQSSYGLLNARAGLGSIAGGWKLEAFVDNATDKAYFIQAARQPVGALVSAGGVAGATGMVGWYGAPRVWGIQATWQTGR